MVTVSSLPEMTMGLELGGVLSDELGLLGAGEAGVEGDGDLVAADGDF